MTGIDIAMIVVALVVLLLVERYASWQHRDAHRRSDRLILRNLRRMGEQ